MTTESGVSGAAETACHATPRGSTSAPTSSGTLLGKFSTAPSGTTTESLKPPPPPESPMKPPFSHTFSEPAVHALHFPQYIVGWTTTFWPTVKPESSDPTSVTVPENSCPKVMGMVSFVHGCGVVGAKLGPPRYSWRSVPQIPTKAGATYSSSAIVWANP
ncbi:sorbitol dehydrogenase [Alternaria alternata]|nr:sorbitol dehydrogenase [Alternaria alternata]